MGGRVVLEVAEKIEGIHLGRLQIQEDQVRGMALNRADGLVLIAGESHGAAISAQDQRQRFRQLGIIAINRG